MPEPSCPAPLLMHPGTAVSAFPARMLNPALPTDAGRASQCPQHRGRLQRGSVPALKPALSRVRGAVAGPWRPRLPHPGACPAASKEVSHPRHPPPRGPNAWQPRYPAVPQSSGHLWVGCRACRAWPLASGSQGAGLGPAGFVERRVAQRSKQQRARVCLCVHGVMSVGHLPSHARPPGVPQTVSFKEGARPAGWAQDGAAWLWVPGLPWGEPCSVRSLPEPPELLPARGTR